VIGFLLCTQTVKVLALLEAGIEPLVQSGQECITVQEFCQALGNDYGNRVGESFNYFLLGFEPETGLECKRKISAKKFD
jgi:hypothetical protein